MAVSPAVAGSKSLHIPALVHFCHYDQHVSLRVEQWKAEGFTQQKVYTGMRVVIVEGGTSAFFGTLGGVCELEKRWVNYTVHCHGRNRLTPKIIRLWVPKQSVRLSLCAAFQYWRYASRLPDTLNGPFEPSRPSVNLPREQWNYSQALRKKKLDFKCVGGAVGEGGGGRGKGKGKGKDEMCEEEGSVGESEVYSVVDSCSHE